MERFFTSALYFTAVQSVLLAAVLILGKPGKNNRVSLGILLLLAGLSNLMHTPFPADLIGEELTSALFSPLLYLFGPMLWMYTKGFWEGDTANRGLPLHFIPYIFCLIVFSAGLIPGIGERLIMLHQALNILKLLHFLIYNCLAIFYHLRRYSALKNERANPENARTGWLLFILLTYLTVFIILAVSGTFFLLDGNEQALRTGSAAGSIGACLLISITAVLGYIRPQMIFNETDRKYADSPLSDAEAKRLFIQLEQDMDREKWYLSEDLNIRELSAVSGIPHYNLSRIINQFGGSNFYNYINTRRIEAVKVLLREHPEKTVLDIALECGFNSKSAFNTAFKRFTGETPLRYRKKNI